MARARARIEDHHADWLSLVETGGPFLTVPALKRALPDGLEATPDALRDLRVAYAEWQDDPGLQHRWIRWVLDELLGLRDAVTDATDADPSHRLPEHAVTLHPSHVVRDHPPSYSSTASKPGPRWIARFPVRPGPPARSTAQPSSPGPRT